MKPLHIFLLLALTMIAGRYHHFGSVLQLPDASLAVFFIAGFYLRPVRYFVIFLGLAAIIDMLAIALGTVGNFCISPAYGMLIPAYASLWFGGRWLAAHYKASWKIIPLVIGTLFVSTTVAYVISNGSFYLLSGNFTDLSWFNYVIQAKQYFTPYLTSAFFYVGLTMLIQWLCIVIAGSTSLTHSPKVNIGNVGNIE